MISLLPFHNIESKTNDKTLNTRLASSDTTSSSFLDVMNSAKSGVEDIKIKQQFNLDMKRLAGFMGIGPKILQAVLGDLKIDPQNFNFNPISNEDFALRDIAQYFGISPMTMQAILDKLNIDRSDLVDVKKENKIIMKLSKLLKLKPEEEDDIQKILKQYQEKQ